MDKIEEMLSLDHLRQKLAASEWDRLGLQFLDPLRNEILGRQLRLELADKEARKRTGTFPNAEP